MELKEHTTTKDTPLDWFYDKIKGHFEHDGDLQESVIFAYSIAKQKEREQTDNDTEPMTTTVAIDRQKAYFDTAQVYCYWYQCPSCGDDNIRSGNNYCPNCGCKFEWSGEQQLITPKPSKSNSSVMTEARQQSIIAFLEKTGYVFDKDADGIWLEENIGSDHTFKDIIELLAEYADQERQTSPIFAKSYIHKNIQLSKGLKELNKTGGLDFLCDMSNPELW